MIILWNNEWINYIKDKILNYFALMKSMSHDKSPGVIPVSQKFCFWHCLLIKIKKCFYPTPNSNWGGQWSAGQGSDPHAWSIWFTPWQVTSWDPDAGTHTLYRRRSPDPPQVEEQPDQSPQQLHEEVARVPAIFNSEHFESGLGSSMI